jgi:hypothetical protein
MEDEINESCGTHGREEKSLTHGAEPFLRSRVHLLKNFFTVYGTRRFITAFTGPYPEPDLSNPYEGREVHTEFQSQYVKGRNHLGDGNENCRIILK